MNFNPSTSMMGRSSYSDHHPHPPPISTPRFNYISTTNHSHAPPPSHPPSALSTLPRGPPVPPPPKRPTSSSMHYQSQRNQPDPQYQALPPKHHIDRPLAPQPPPFPPKCPLPLPPVIPSHSNRITNGITNGIPNGIPNGAPSCCGHGHSAGDHGHFNQFNSCNVNQSGISSPQSDSVSTVPMPHIPNTQLTPTGHPHHHSVTHSVNHSVNHSVAHSDTHSVAHPGGPLGTQLGTHLGPHSGAHSGTHSGAHSVTHSHPLPPLHNPVLRETLCPNTQSLPTPAALSLNERSEFNDYTDVHHQPAVPRRVVYQAPAFPLGMPTSAIPINRLERPRKRRSVKMEMSSTQSTGALTAESPTTSVGTEPAAKRRKTGNGTSSHKKGLNKEKMSRVAAVRDAKFKNAMNVLRAFAKDHGGKLPSLRFMMKMLKVGFPKAHEIKKQYGEREGYTIDQVTELMTVRQENGGKDKGTASTSSTSTNSGGKSGGKSGNKHGGKLGGKSCGKSGCNSVGTSGSGTIPGTSSNLGSSVKPRGKRKKRTALEGVESKESDSATSSDDTAEVPSLWSMHSRSQSGSSSQSPRQMTQQMTSHHPHTHIEHHHGDHTHSLSQHHHHHHHGHFEWTTSLREELATLLDGVHSESLREDFSVRSYLRRILELEQFMRDKFGDFDLFVLQSFGVTERSLAGSAYFMLSEGYYGYDGRRGLQIGALYAQKALDMFEGEAVSRRVHWREIVKVLMLRGQFRRDQALFMESHNDYDRVASILQSVRDQESLTELETTNLEIFDIEHLHHLISLHCAQNRYAESVRCSKALVPIYERRRMLRSAVEAKAWLSCTLMLCNDDMTATNEGYAMYKEIVSQSEEQWNEWTAKRQTLCVLPSELRPIAPYRWYTYFVVHFMQSDQWMESYQLMDLMLQWEHGERPFDVLSTNQAFERYTDYLRANGKTVDENKEAVNVLMERLHIRQMEVMGMLMDELRTGKWRQMDGVDGDGRIGIGANVGFEGIEVAFCALKEERAPNIVATLIKHILIFRQIGNGTKADEILYSAVRVGEDSKWVNRQSGYFAKFETVQFGENDEHSLLGLC